MKGLNRLALLLDELLLEALLAGLGVFVPTLLELLLDELLELLAGVPLELVLVELLELWLDGIVAPLLDPLPELLLEVLSDPLDGDTGLSVIVNWMDGYGK